MSDAFNYLLRVILERNSHNYVDIKSTPGTYLLVYLIFLPGPRRPDGSAGSLPRWGDEVLRLLPPRTLLLPGKLCAAGEPCILASNLLASHVQLLLSLAAWYLIAQHHQQNYITVHLPIYKRTIADMMPQVPVPVVLAPTSLAQVPVPVWLAPSSWFRDPQSLYVAPWRWRSTPLANADAG